MERTHPIILITGASSGIGRTTAAHLAASGYCVLAGVRDRAGRNAAIAAELAALEVVGGGRCIPVELDVTDDRSVQRCVSYIAAQFGRIDVLVNCAGIMWRGISEAFTVAQFEAIMRTNVLGPFRMVKAVLPHMRIQRSGLLIAISSIAGRLVSPGSGLYASSKFALEALSESLRYELSGIGVDSVIVEPGPFQTNLAANGVPPEDAGVLPDYAELQEIISRPRLQEFVRNNPGVSTDPAEVARCIAELVAMPAGTRPLRTTVGYDMGTATINRLVSAEQHAYLERLGLTYLEQPQVG